MASNQLFTDTVRVAFLEARSFALAQAIETLRTVEKGQAIERLDILRRQTLDKLTAMQSQDAGRECQARARYYMIRHGAELY